MRNSNSTRLYWARNANGNRLTEINKTYKVEVIGIFLSDNLQLMNIVMLILPQHQI